VDTLLQCFPEENHGQIERFSRSVEDGTESCTKASGAAERGAGGFGWPWARKRKIAAQSDSQEAETYVRCGPQTNCCGSAPALGDMEEGSA
jgi:hypothetical protein